MPSGGIEAHTLSERVEVESELMGFGWVIPKDWRSPCVCIPVEGCKVHAGADDADHSGLN